MCLGIPGQIIEIGENETAVISVQTVEQQISIALVDVAVGDWVIVHAGFAINKIDADEAQETLRLLADLAAVSDSREP